MVSESLLEFETHVLSRLEQLEYGFINGDFNEQNIIVENNQNSSEDKPNAEEYRIKGVIDFGDVHYASKVGPAYGLSGYLRVRPLTELELNVLFVSLTQIIG